MHFRFDDVHRTSARIAPRAETLQIVQRDRRRDHGIEDPFGHFLAVKQHRFVRHQMADVTDQQQRAAV